MQLIDTLKKAYLAYESEQSFNPTYPTLYDPADYILKLGGKKMRPVMLLLANHVMGGDIEKALPAAYAVEMFHNFTLMHDDIMDKAEMRRGKPAVHVKYNTNQAILSGDALAIMSYEYVLANYPSDLGWRLLQIFNKMALEVCEGQQMDMDFEEMTEVEIPAYFKMIELKTSVLIGAAMQMGALIGGASDKQALHLYEYCKNAGVAFQVQDDVLDTFGEQAKTGKRVGGDILNNKKTYLYLKSLDLASANEKSRLNELFASKADDEESKIEEVKGIYKNVHVMEYASQVMEAYMQLSDSHAKSLELNAKDESFLLEFSSMLVERES